MKNIKKPYSRLENVLKFYYVSTRVVYDAEYKSFEEEGLKILTLKQLLQKITNSSCTNISTEWNKTNHIFFVSSKRNYWKNIQQYNEF